MSNWFKRGKDGIQTPTYRKTEAPDGLWIKCPSCKKPTLYTDLANNLQVCPWCEYHYNLDSESYFSLLFDEGQYDELDAELVSGDPLNFQDKKTYASRLQAAQEKTDLKDAVRTASGALNGRTLVVACMDFSFIGGSMGSVVGEKIARAIDAALERKTPFLMISKSGGARMMEGALSLMQMAKTSARLALLDNAGLPYVSLMTDPTTGGVTASYAMLGDVNLAEPGALIGFAGPRVVRETIGKELPDGFQRSEFLLEQGFLDQIVHRKELKPYLDNLLGLLTD